VFGHLLGLGSFDSLEEPLACKQAFLPITFGNIGFILTITIAPTTYLGSWALVASIIDVRFMVDQCFFLLEALTRIDNNTFFSNNISRWLVIFYHPSTSMSSSLWTIHWVTNGSTSRFHLGSFTPSYLFQHALW
jgi:hypothetical protein